MKLRTHLRGAALLIALATLLACTPGRPAQPAAPAQGSAPAASGAAGASEPSAGSGAPAASNAPSGSSAPAASSAPTAVAPLDPPVSVTLGLPYIIADAGVYIAQERGYFAAEGLHVDMVQAQSSSGLLPLLASNQVQFGSSSLDPAVLNAVLRGINIKIVEDKARFRAESGTAALMARADLYDSGELRELPQIRGKTIATMGRNLTPDYYMETAFKKVGLTLDDVQFAQVQLTDMPVALANKAVDAAWMYEPLLTTMMLRGLAYPLIDAGQIVPDEYPQVLYVSEAFAQENPEAVRRFVTAHLRGQRDYYRAFVQNEADRSEIIQYLIKYTPVKDPAMYEKMRFHAVEPNGYIDPRPIDRYQDFCIEKGILPQRVDLSTLIDPQYVNYAVDRLGRLPDPYR
ncbi:MAG TPA: ABC transporter substrate-binding protein [Chloroflexota bacterium]|jgi:NitT/TauT family transport system substrate-binding protein